MQLPDRETICFWRKFKFFFSFFSRTSQNFPESQNSKKHQKTFKKNDEKSNQQTITRTRLYLIQTAPRETVIQCAIYQLLIHSPLASEPYLSPSLSTYFENIPFVLKIEGKKVKTFHFPKSSFHLL